jgi:hypothetical protein
VPITTQQLASSGETWEGSLVVLHDVTIVGGAWPAQGDDGVVSIDDGSGACELFIDGDTGVDEAGPPAEPTFSVRGLVQQLDDSFPYLEGHRVVPRYADDLFQIQGVGVSELPSHHGVTRTQLLPNWPNPFAQKTTILFDLAGPKQQTARLAAYDVSGRLVKTLAEGSFAAGSYEVRWEGTDERGARLSPGVYFLRLETPGASDSRKVVLLE